MTRREETTTMKKDTPTLGKVIEIDEARIEKIREAILTLISPNN